MKRIVLWVLSTLSTLVVLFGYHTSTSSRWRQPWERDHDPGPRAGAVGTRPPAAAGPLPLQQRPSTSTGSPGTASTVTGDAAQTRYGPVQVQLQVSGSDDHQRVGPAVPRPGRPRPPDQQLRAAAAGPGHPRLAGRLGRDGQRRDVHQRGLRSSRSRARSTRPGCDDHRCGADRPVASSSVMGMPISLALRGRHAHDDAAEQAWRGALAELRWVDEVFSTWRPDSQVSRLGRGEVTLAECVPEVAEVLRLGDAAKASSDGAFDVCLPGPDGVRRLDPSGVVKGWAVDRAVRPAAGAGRHRRVPVGRRRHGVPRRRPGGRTVADRHRAPPRPDPTGRAGPGAPRSGGDLRIGAPRDPRGRRPVRRLLPARWPPSPSSGPTSPASTSTPRPRSPSGSTAPTGCAHGCAPGVVVWADGRAETVA